MNDLKIISKNTLSVNDIKTIIKVINDSTGRTTIETSKEKPLAKKYNVDGGYTVYAFGFNSAVSGEEADSLIGGLYNTLEFDFVAEINSDIVDYEEDIDDNIEEKDSVKHSRWVQEQMDEGWSYGLEFDESNKKNPYIRPYHQLTKSQKKLIDKSKSKLGHYGVYYPYLLGDKEQSNSDVDGGGE